MKYLLAFLRLIRTLNLLFIVATQCLFYYAIMLPNLRKAGMVPLLDEPTFWLLVFASVCIAAAGYVINDYFDINIDMINKPGRLVVDKIIRRRWAMFWHWLLSSIGVLLSSYIGWKLHHSIFLGVVNLATVILLWVYSTTLKRSVLLGNLVIALLTAWVVMILYFVEAGYHFFDVDKDKLTVYARIFKFTIVYGGFAFIITLIREVVKDMEDMAGDQRNGCVTLPIVYGIRTAKIFVMTWLGVMMAGILLLQVYVIPFQWWFSILYNVVLVLIPLVIITNRIRNAVAQSDFRKVSHWIKFTMSAGIASMLLMYYYGA